MANPGSGPPGSETHTADVSSWGGRSLALLRPSPAAKLAAYLPDGRVIGRKPG
jgi:hypothetical protein